MNFDCKLYELGLLVNAEGCAKTLPNYNFQKEPELHLVPPPGSIRCLHIDTLAAFR